MCRHLRLERLESGKAELIESTIDKIVGIDSVSINEDQHKLDVSYDASQVNINQIESIINQYGNGIGSDWWTKFKKSWYQFTDSNTMSNARHKPGCCNKPPR